MKKKTRIFPKIHDYIFTNNKNIPFLKQLGTFFEANA